MKSGFTYAECPDCATLWVTPRPRAGALADFYRSAKSVDYWHSAFYRETAEARRERLFRPRAALVGELLGRPDGPSGGVGVDVGAGYGLFLEEMARLGAFDELLGIEPNPALAGVCRERGFQVVERPVEDIEPGEVQADMATAFEVLEHVHDPHAFLTAVRGILAPGSWLLLTTLTSSGFDIRTLWERSKSIAPPQHLNVLSVEGMRLLMERTGFEIVELSTPGQLDVDIVENMRAQDPEVPLPRFLSYLFAHRDAAVRAEFQAFLQRALLSSHIRVLARRV